MLLGQKGVIDAWWSSPYTKGTASPLILGDEAEKRQTLGVALDQKSNIDTRCEKQKSLSSPSFLENCDISRASRRSDRLPGWGAAGRCYLLGLSQGLQRSGVSACSPLFFLG